MRKLLIGALIIVPFFAAAALVASGILIQKTCDIVPSAIVIRDIDGNILGGDRVFEVDARNRNDYVTVQVYPEYAPQEVVFEKDGDSSSETEVAFRRDGQTGRYIVEPCENSDGVVYEGRINVSVLSAGTPAVKTVLPVQIVTRCIGEFAVYLADGSPAPEVLRISDPVKLFADVYPSNAVKDGTVEWRSDNPDVATVSQSGIVFPVSQGIAAIRGSILDKMGNRASCSVTIDTTSSLVRRTHAKTSEPVNADWISANLVIDDLAEVNEIAPGTYRVSRDGTGLTVTAEVCRADDWDFDCVYGTVYTGSGPYAFGISYSDFALSGGYIDVAFSVSDRSMATIDASGRLIPLKEGRITVTAEALGRRKTQTVNVVRRANEFGFVPGVPGGIADRRVWASQWIDASGAVSREYLLPVDCDQSYRWQSSDPRIAAVDGDGLVTFAADSAGRTVKITATLVIDGHPTRYKRTYTFVLSPQETALNVSDYGGLAAAASDYPGRAVYLQKDIEMRGTVGLSGSLYGNGFALDARLWQGMDAQTAVLAYRATGADAEVNGAVIEAAGSVLTAAGRGIGVLLENADCKIVLRNTVIRNVGAGIVAKDVRSLLVEGCVLGGAAGEGLTIMETSGAERSVTLRNNVIAGCGGFAVFAAPAAPEANRLPKLSIEGFLDIYNWKTLDETRTLFAGLAERLVPGTALEAETAEIASSLFAGNLGESLVYADPSDGRKYFQAGLFMVGFVSESDSRVRLLDGSLKQTEVDTPRDDGTPLGEAAKHLAALAKQRTGADYAAHPCCLVAYDSAKPRIAPADTVPNYDSLIRRMRGLYAAETN